MNSISAGCPMKKVPIFKPIHTTWGKFSGTLCTPLYKVAKYNCEFCFSVVKKPRKIKQFSSNIFLSPCETETCVLALIHYRSFIMFTFRFIYFSFLLASSLDQ